MKNRNNYSRLLKEQGRYIVSVEGVDWYEYQGFMMPAYLPHAVPPITKDLARKVLKVSKRLFARWDSDFDILSGSWWHIIHKGPWSLDMCSRNTRSKIKRGRKHFTSRIAITEEIASQGHHVCMLAQERYGSKSFVPPKQVFEQKVILSRKYCDNYEFFGVFDGDRLVGFSENYIQDNAVFLEEIWYEPAALSKYSSYVLIDSILNYYLNEKKYRYVSDGARNLYHKTNVHDFLVEKFGFSKCYSKLNVQYSSLFGVCVFLAYPCRKLFGYLAKITGCQLLYKICGIIKQETIAKEALQKK